MNLETALDDFAARTITADDPREAELRLAWLDGVEAALAILGKQRSFFTALVKTMDQVEDDYLILAQKWVDRLEVEANRI